MDKTWISTMMDDMHTRAYSAIDSGTVTLGNRWSERTWSAFIGRTTGWRERASEREWIAGSCPEFTIFRDGVEEGAMDLGATEWTEEYNPFGAAVIARHMGELLELHAWAFAFHENAGFLRRCTVMNRSDTELYIEAVAIEMLKIERRNTRVLFDGFEQRAESKSAEANDAWALQDADGGGIIFGIDGGGHYDAFATDDALLSLRCPLKRTLAPGDSVLLPEAYCFPFSGSLLRTQNRGYADFLLALKKMRHWEFERTRDGG